MDLDFFLPINKLIKNCCFLVFKLVTPCGEDLECRIQEIDRGGCAEPVNIFRCRIEAKCFQRNPGYSVIITIFCFQCIK